MSDGVSCLKVSITALFGISCRGIQICVFSEATGFWSEEEFELCKKFCWLYISYLNVKDIMNLYARFIKKQTSPLRKEPYFFSLYTGKNS